MDKRQAETEALLLEYEKQCLKDLQKAYTEALADVKKKLKALGDREPIQSVVYQVQFQEMLQEQLKTALDSLKNGSIESVRDFLNKTYEDSYLGTIYSIQGQGIPVYLGMDHEQVARTVNRKTDSLQFSQRLYGNVDKLGIAYKSQMSRGIANGSSYSKIAKQLALESEANYNQAMRIVRTEGGRVKSEAKLDSMKGAKKQGADIVKQWDATFDSKTRAEHRYLDGQIREIDEPFEDSKGRKAQAPHKFGIASMDVNCRCIVVERARWAIEGEEMPAKMDNTTGELVEAKNYKEWKEKYQRKQAEKKPAPNNAKVFDKNSKDLPNKDDLFKLPNNELVKIVEVNDYNGIKSVTLENGQNVVLGNVTEEPKRIKRKQLENKGTASAIDQIMTDINVSRLEAINIRNKIGWYTENGYMQIRNTNPSEAALKARDKIEDYIAKAPVFDGDIYRGIHTRDVDFVKSLKVGATIDMQGISSWSSDINVASRYAKNGGTDTKILFIAKNKSGVGIKHISSWAEESEVLQSGKTRFVIKETAKNTNDGIEVINIVLEEA